MADRKTQTNVDHASVKSYYDTEYYGGKAGVLHANWHLRSIARRLGNLSGVDVLDVACGEGVWLSELASLGANPHGVDISAKAVASCRKRLPQAQVHEGVAESLPFPDRKFGLVTCLGSLEHFLDKDAALGEMVRVGRDDARYLILVPNAGFLTRRLGLYKGTQQSAIKEDVLSLDEWKSMLDKAGLQVERCWRDLHMMNFSWVNSSPWVMRPVRLAQVVALALWPIRWQYQVYFWCRNKGSMIS